MQQICVMNDEMNPFERGRNKCQH